MINDVCNNVQQAMNNFTEWVRSFRVNKCDTSQYQIQILIFNFNSHRKGNMYTHWLYKCFQRIQTTRFVAQYFILRSFIRCQWILRISFLWSFVESVESIVRNNRLCYLLPLVVNRVKRNFQIGASTVFFITVVETAAIFSVSKRII